MPIIDDAACAALDRAALRQSLRHWLIESPELLHIVCDFGTDADLLIELIDAQTDHALRALNIASITVLSAEHCDEISQSIDRYFLTPQQWPRHHALEDARALRHACGALKFTAETEIGETNRG